MRASECRDSQDAGIRGVSLSAIPHSRLLHIYRSHLHAGTQRMQGKARQARAGRKRMDGMQGLPTHHSHSPPMHNARESRATVNARECAGMRARGKQEGKGRGMQGNRRDIYSPDISRLITQIHRDNACMTKKGSHRRKQASKHGENLRENSRETRLEIRLGRKPNAELYLELGPGLGLRLRQSLLRVGSSHHFFHFLSPCSGFSPCPFIHLRCLTTTHSMEQKGSSVTFQYTGPSPVRSSSSGISSPHSGHSSRAAITDSRLPQDPVPGGSDAQAVRAHQQVPHPCSAFTAQVHWFTAYGSIAVASSCLIPVFIRALSIPR